MPLLHIREEKNKWDRIPLVQIYHFARMKEKLPVQLHQWVFRMEVGITEDLVVVIFHVQHFHHK